MNQEDDDDIPNPNDIFAINQWIDEGNPNAWEAEISWQGKSDQKTRSAKEEA